MSNPHINDYRGTCAVCGAAFKGPKHKRFCSYECRLAGQSAELRAYRAEHGEAMRAYERAYYLANSKRILAMKKRGRVRRALEAAS